MRTKGVPVSTSRAQSPDLNRTEKEILRLLVQGASTRDAAKAVNLALPTVERYIVRLRLKMGARNTTHLIARAISTGALKVVRGAMKIVE